MQKITEKLILEIVEANNWHYDDENNKINTAWHLGFSFYGETDFSCYITKEALDGTHPDFAMIESFNGDLHDSFSAGIEEHWDKLVAAIHAYEAELIKDSKKCRSCGKEKVLIAEPDQYAGWCHECALTDASADSIAYDMRSAEIENFGNPD